MIQILGTATVAVMLAFANPVAIENGQVREIGPAVTSPEAAIAIGKIYLQSRYGDVEGSGPYTATYKNEVWTVQGKLPPPGSVGGTLTVQLDGSDGRLLKMIADE